MAGRKILAYKLSTSHTQTVGTYLANVKILVFKKQVIMVRNYNLKYYADGIEEYRENEISNLNANGPLTRLFRWTSLE